MKLLGIMAVLFLMLETLHIVLHKSAPIYIPINSAQTSLLSISLPTLAIYCLFMITISDILLQFLFASPWWLMMSSIFSYTCWPFECSLEKKSIQIFYHFFIFLLDFLNTNLLELLMFCILTPYQILVCKYFPHFINCLFCCFFYFIDESFLVWCHCTCLFLLLFLVLWVSSPRNYCQDQCKGVFQLCFFF